MAPFLSVIIPAYNEAMRLPSTLADIASYLRNIGFLYEIIVVDDGSTDMTVDVVEKIGVTISHLSLLRLGAHKGKGAAVRAGMLAARGAIRLFTDADNSTPIAEFAAMLPYLAGEGAKKYDIVIGSRAVHGAQLNPSQPFYRVFLGKAGNIFLQLFLVPGIWDTQCGFKAFTADAAEKIFCRARVDGWGFDGEVLALARHLGLSVREIPVRWRNDSFSHLRFLSYLKVLWETITIRLTLWRGGYD